MKIHRTAGLMALALAASLASGGRAYATFDYSTALTITSVSGGGTFTNTATGGSAVLDGTTLTLTNVTRTGFAVPSVNTANIGDVAVTSTTAPPATASFTVGYTDVVTLTNNGPPGTNANGPVTVSGVLTVNQVNTGTGIITNIYNAPSTVTATIGGVILTLNASSFGNPTVNGASGNLGGTITAAVPEPSSVALMGIGLVAAVGVSVRRKRNAV